MIFDPVIPIPWIILIAIVMLGVTTYHQMVSSRRLGMVRRITLLTARLCGIIIVILLFLQPMRIDLIPVPAVEKSLLVAVDTSQSMREAHRDGSSRIDAARADLEKAGMLRGDDSRIRLFGFDQIAIPTNAEALLSHPCGGENTLFNASMTSLLRTNHKAPPAGVIVLSDGHDFEMVSPGDIAKRMRAHSIPVYTVPYGTTRSARDVSLGIANYHPHTFVRQKTQLQAMLRLFSCSHEVLTVDLYRDNEKVDSKDIESGTDTFLTVSFDVAHEEPGQYEYTFKVRPVANERELSNNSATTYLNVISERIQILEIEGRPFWDSTFLRRSFSRNDKFDIDSLVAFTNDRVRPISSNDIRDTAKLKPPTTVDDLQPYNIVILGREVERVIGQRGILAIKTWVKDHGGILIFSRGKAWSDRMPEASDLEPIDWASDTPKGVRLEVTPQAGSVAAFRILREVASEDTFPEVIAFPAAGKPKRLATTFSVTQDQSPAAVYRRFGSGQTLSLGVGNLWRWVFNPDAHYDNNAYDRFWDHIALWMLANGGVTPADGFSLRADTSNLPLGETLHLRYSAYGEAVAAANPAIKVYLNDREVVSLSPEPGINPSTKEVAFTPKSVGRHIAKVVNPDGSVSSTRFIVFRKDEEATETAMDTTFLEELAKASSGRMIDASEIADLAEQLLQGSDHQDPLKRQTPLWDNPRIFILLCLIFGIEWHLRRRWGLT